jgi:hypothetical protein
MWLGGGRPCGVKYMQAGKKEKQIDINHTQEGIGHKPVGQGEQWEVEEEQKA